MTVSSTSLEEILPIKIPLHERTGRYNKTHFDEDGGFEGFNVTIYSDYFHV
ncbi:unnamed protein product [Brassica napus]|uniref:(rape) hypothetical protein n=1 Tax=Brassica napus TaxID=3708 RepID=A0A817BUD9_BRANA|nr:unnamed protein product [Brassica napus]